MDRLSDGGVLFIHAVDQLDLAVALQDEEEV